MSSVGVDLRLEKDDALACTKQFTARSCVNPLASPF
jgi:hypothetical protein